MAVTIDGTTGITTPAISSTTPAGVASGGTGATTLTANNVVLGNGTSAVQFVAPGTNGNVLTSTGTTWASSTPAAAGSMIFLSSQTANNSATIDLETGLSATYKQYVIVVSNYRPATAGTNLLLRQKIGSTYQTSGYQYVLNYTGAGSGGFAFLNSTSASEVLILYNQNATAQNTGVVIYANNPVYTPSVPNTTAHAVYWLGSSNGGNFQMAEGTGGLNSSTAAVTGYRFLSSSGNISTGTFSLYGIANS